MGGRRKSRRGWLTGLAATLAPLAVGALLAVGWQAVGPPAQSDRFQPRAAARYGQRATVADTSQTSSRSVTVDPGQPAVPLVGARGHDGPPPPEFVKLARDGLVQGHRGDREPRHRIGRRRQPARRKHARGQGRPERAAPRNPLRSYPGVPEKINSRNPERVVVTATPAPTGIPG
jgi:hypothetical protein